MRITPLEIARSQIGVRESGGRNRGPQVDEYLRSVGLDPAKGGVKGYAWCAAGVFWCVREAYQRDYAERGQSGPATLPIKATPWVWDLLKNRDRICNPKPGCVFVMSKSKVPSEMPFHAHCGFVDVVRGNVVDTIEFNTNVEGSREGDGVYKRTRKIADLHRFIDVM